MSISLRHGAAGLLGWRTGRTARSRAGNSFVVETNEALEQRLAMSATTVTAPAIQMLSATTTDSKSVTIDYQVDQGSGATTPLQFGVYHFPEQWPVQRERFAGGDDHAGRARHSMGQGAITLDQNGQPATAVGAHQVTLPPGSEVAALPGEAVRAGRRRPEFALRDR